MVLKCWVHELDGQVTRRSGNQTRFMRKKKNVLFSKASRLPAARFQSKSRRALHCREIGRGVELTNEISQIPRFGMRGANLVDAHMLQCLKEILSSLLST